MQHGALAIQRDNRIGSAAALEEIDDTLGVHGHPRDHPQFPLFSWRMNRQSRTREGEPRSPVEEGVQLRGVSLASTLGEKGQAAEQRETSD